MARSLIGVPDVSQAAGVDAAAIRIVIADQFPIFRDGLRRLLERDGRLQIVGDTALDAVVSVVAELMPNILLLGPQPYGAWRDVLVQLRATAPTVRTILLAAAIDAPDVTDAMQIGACGVVAKDSPADVLFKGIETVAAGALWIGAAPVEDDIAASVRRLDCERRRQQRFGLTRRELEIVRAVVGGHTNKEIAVCLAISQNTVKRHLLHIFNKLGASSRVELALFAAHHRLLEDH